MIVTSSLDQNGGGQSLIVRRAEIYLWTRIRITMPLGDAAQVEPEETQRKDSSTQLGEVTKSQGRNHGEKRGPISTTSWRSKETFLHSLKLAVRIFFFSALSMFSLPIFLGWVLNTSDMESWSISPSQNTTFVLHSAAYMPGKSLGVILTEALVPRAFAVIILPACIAVTLSLKTKRQLILSMSLLTVGVLFLYSLCGTIRLHIDGFMLTQFYYAVVIFLIKILLPSSSKAWLLALSVTFAIGIAQISISIIYHLSSSGAIVQAISAALLIPLLRESILMPLRYITRAFILGRWGSQSKTVVTEFSCLFLILTPSIGVSVFGRLMTQAINDPVLLTFSILAQCIVEISFRLTMYSRDQFVWMRCSRVSRVASFSQVVMLQQTVFDSTFMFFRSCDPADFTSIFIILEMLSEYISIFSTLFYLPMLWRYRFMFSFSLYAEYDVLQSNFDFTWPLVTTVGMVLAELAVDSICSMYEINQMKMPLVECWTGIKFNGKLKLATMSLVLATSGTLNAVFNASHYEYRSCYTANYCYCHKGDHNSIVKDYCRHLFPFTDGVPHGLQAYFVLGKDTHKLNSYTFESLDSTWVSPLSSSVSFAGYFVDNAIRTFASFSTEEVIDRIYQVTDVKGDFHHSYFSANISGLAIFLIQEDENMSSSIYYSHQSLCNTTMGPPVVILRNPSNETFHNAVQGLLEEFIDQDYLLHNPCNVTTSSLG